MGVNCTVAPGYSAPICCKGGKGTLLSAEQPFPCYTDDAQAGLAILYLVLLLWTFMGVGQAADAFMGAIEMITSTKSLVKQRMPDGTTRSFRVSAWNPTVANLTLMALGSSAPEILLSIIELVSNEMFSGDLGPATIVGSASFNLLVILAVCVVAIPASDARKIAQPRVYAITAFFSVFAYVWLIIILMVVTPDVITVAEAVVTFAFFPLLVWMAFVADKWADPSFKARWTRRLTCASAAGDGEVLPNAMLLDVKNPDGSPLSAEELIVMVKSLRRTATGLAMSEEKAVQQIALQMASRQPKSRAYYRISATRSIVGAPPLPPPVLVTEPSGGSASRASYASIAPEEKGQPSTPPSAPQGTVVEFAAPSYGVIEAAGHVTVSVVRHGGDLQQRVSVSYATVDGSAKGGDDYEATSGTLELAPGIKSGQITVRIFDDDEIEPDEEFRIVLEAVVAGEASLGPTRSTTVTVINDDFPGTLTLPHEHLTVKESAGLAHLRVERVQGCSGTVGCCYRTIDGSALAGRNYEATTGQLEWSHQDVAAKIITIPLVDDDQHQGKVYFEVEITDATGGAIFDASTDGSKERSLARIAIEDDDEVKTIADRTMKLLGMSHQSVRLGASSWKEQFSNAFVIGGPDDAPSQGEGEEAPPPRTRPSPFAMIQHALSMPWKLLTALVPPPQISHGYPCFVGALCLIGVLTAVIGDLANLLGCALGLKPSVVAITLVALGTSLPDTFASRAAAIGDVTADAAIGNVTGSNAVNVFLGLGISWALGAIYWTALGADAQYLTRAYREPSTADASRSIGQYYGMTLGSTHGLVVPAGALGISVGVFCGCACACLATLLLRRIAFGAELGTKLRWPTFAFFCLLWVVYIVVSSLVAYEMI